MYIIETGAPPPQRKSASYAPALDIVLIYTYTVCVAKKLTFVLFCHSDSLQNDPIAMVLITR